MPETLSTSVDYVCPDCNLVFPLPRQKSKLRRVGHKKKLYCPHCKAEKNFIQLKKN